MTEILFITEARSSDIKSFFRCNTQLYRSVKRAFETLYGKFDTNDEFLAFFRKMNCNLDYLITRSFDRKNTVLREVLRFDSIEFLSKRLQNYKPQCIIIVMKDIEKYVRQAIVKAKLPEDITIRIVPFPAGNAKNRINCEQEVFQIIKRYFAEDKDH